MDFIVFSHLRWNFVYQRPQHLLSRCAASNRVFFWEEPLLHDGDEIALEASHPVENLTVLVPRLPKNVGEEEKFAIQRELLDGFLESQQLSSFALWYYTPMAMNFSRHLDAAVVVYDCMDELSGFRGAPPGLRAAEQELFRSADVVFTGGQSLYEAKKHQHANVYAFPSSIDAKHFRQARGAASEAEDQRAIPHPRMGFCGVVDERFDIELLTFLADTRPEWQFIIIGPVVKIDPHELPRRSNIHYLGGRDYKQLPAYLAGWDVALLLFAMNEATRYISPTKTPEYLAAGKPVVSTPITDVVRPYGNLGLVRIGSTHAEFAQAIEQSLSPEACSAEWLSRVDAFLAKDSWDLTWSRMFKIVIDIARAKQAGLDERDEAQAETAEPVAAD